MLTPEKEGRKGGRRGKNVIQNVNVTQYFVDAERFHCTIIEMQRY